jgi:hypothetical protein
MGGIGMKRIFVAAATVAVFALLVSSPALAAKGGKGGGKGSQAITAEPSITVHESNPSYGDTVTFTATYPEMKYPALVDVWCSQGGVSVWHVAGVVTDPFPMGGGSWTGGEADCTAELFYYAWQGMTQTGPFHLANTFFHVVG